MTYSAPTDIFIIIIIVVVSSISSRSRRRQAAVAVSAGEGGGGGETVGRTGDSICSRETRHSIAADCLSTMKTGPPRAATQTARRVATTAATPHHQAEQRSLPSPPPHRHPLPRSPSSRCTAAASEADLRRAIRAHARISSDTTFADNSCSSGGGGVLMTATLTQLASLWTEDQASPTLRRSRLSQRASERATN